jgi:hypothetical protein
MPICSAIGGETVMPLEFSFGQVEAVLAKLNRIADHKRVAFMSRLKHLQKNGCPRRDRPGRGKAGTYSFSQLMQTAIAVDLLQSGLPPALAAQIVAGNFMAIRPTIYIATFTAAEVSEINEARVRDGLDERDAPEEWLWMISPEALRDMTEDGLGEFDHYEAIVPVPLVDARRQLETGVTVGVFGEGWRTLVIHGSNLTQAVMTAVAYHFRFASWEAMRNDLKEEMDEDERRFTEVMREIEAGGPLLTEERRAEFKRKFGDLRETDYSTNPPTPPGLIVERAKEIILRTDRKVLAAIAAEEGATIEIDGPTMKQLLFLRLLEMNDGIAEFTHLGAVVNTFLRDPKLAQAKIGIDTSDPALGRGDY